MHPFWGGGKWGFFDSETLLSQFFKKRLLQKIRGEFFRTKLRVNFAGDFLVDFFGPFSLEKVGGKNPPKNPRQNSNRNLGVSRPKSTLQGSSLDNFGVLDPCTGRTDSQGAQKEARRETANAEIQYNRPHFVDRTSIADTVFADSVSETPIFSRACRLHVPLQFDFQTRSF